MSLTRIKGKPVSYTRVAIRTASGNITADDCIPVIEPKITYESTEQKYNVLKDDRYASPTVRNMIYRKLTYKTPFYMPFTDMDNGSRTFGNLVDFYKRQLVPCGLLCAVGYDIGEYKSGIDGAAFLLNPEWQAYTGAKIAYQELTEIESITNAMANFKLDFSTDNGMILEMEWTGEDAGITTGSTFASPIEPGVRPNFELANLVVWKAGEAKPTYYLPCRQYTFDFGNNVDMYDDCNSKYGVGGFFIGNILDNQKVSFDCLAPEQNGTAITANSFPWHTYFKNGDILRYEMTFPTVALTGDSTVTPIIAGCFQLNDNVDRNEDKQLRRIKIGGTCMPYGNIPAFLLLFNRIDL